MVTEKITDNLDKLTDMMADTFEKLKKLIVNKLN